MLLVVCPSVLACLGFSFRWMCIDKPWYFSWKNERALKNKKELKRKSEQAHPSPSSF